MKDGHLEGLRIKALPQDSIEIDKASGRISVGTNLDGNHQETNNILIEFKRINASLLNEIKRTLMDNRRPIPIVFNSFGFRNRKSSGGSSESEKKYKTEFP